MLWCYFPSECQLPFETGIWGPQTWQTFSGVHTCIKSIENKSLGYYPTVEIWQDFSNQVYYWQTYTRECKRNKVTKGIYVTPEIAEHMAGGDPYIKSENQPWV